MASYIEGIKERKQERNPMNQVITDAAASYIEADLEFQSFCYDRDLLEKHDFETQKRIDLWSKIRDDRFEILANLLVLEGILDVSKWIFDNAYNCFKEVTNELH